MKTKLIILLMLLTGQQAYSQIGSGSTLIGGSVQFQSSERANFQEFSFLPNAQYFIRDNISIGGSAGFITSRNNVGQAAYIRTNTIIFSPEARYYIDLGEKVQFYGAASLGIGIGGSKDIDANTSTDVDDETRFNFGINPGILFTPGSKVGFSVELNLISFSRNSNTPAGSNTSFITNNFSFGTNTFAPTFGLYYILGK